MQSTARAGAASLCSMGLLLVELDVPVDGMLTPESCWGIAPGKQQGPASLSAGLARETYLWEHSQISSGDVLSPCGSKAYGIVQPAE